MVVRWRQENLYEGKESKESIFFKAEADDPLAQIIKGSDHSSFANVFS